MWCNLALLLFIGTMVHEFGIPIVSWEQWCLKNKIKDCVFGIPIVAWEQWCLHEIKEQFDIPIVFENNDNNSASWIKIRCSFEDHVFGIPFVYWNNGARHSFCLLEQWCTRDDIEEQFDITEIMLS
ncbi:hypothetical protein ACFE04_015457 [Oxalis oulophora]